MKHAVQEWIEEEESDGLQKTRRQNSPEAYDTNRRMSDMQAYSRKEHEKCFDA